MKNLSKLFILIFLALTYSSFAQKNKIRIDVSNQELNKETTKKITDARLKNNFGFSNNGNVNEKKADIVISLDLPTKDRYVITSYAVTDSLGQKLMAKAKNKYESLFMTLQVDDQKKTKRVVYVPWNVPLQETGKFYLNKNSEIKIWLPKGVILDYIELTLYSAPEVPAIVKNYQPSILPPNEHPRIWVTKSTLPKVKSLLEVGENKEKWQEVKKLAFQKANVTFDKSKEFNFDVNLENLIEAKAFYYLMTQDEEIGNEVIALAREYVSLVEFGNILDVTREIGRTIYIIAKTYDWCYYLLKEEDKKVIHDNLIRLSEDMEVGWPPFLQSIVNGHGNEAQINRDLLSMAIALYDEDPDLYRYCSYAVLEELVPMRKFEYQSHRHNQGINYGAYRYNWDMHAAWLFKRMTNKEVFDPNIKSLSEYWRYSRLPDGLMMKDGDHSLRSKPEEFHFWQINPSSFFMNYTYANDPYVKRDFEKMTNNNTISPILYLLLNDPNLASQELPSNYPLTKDYGPILGAMTNRTGWEINMESNNVVAEIKGGGYQFANHQHPDAGSLQIYHRGFQVADLGLYKFYGTPYDMNFTKRSVSHSMMLAIDPNEKFGRYPSNDGGGRMVRTFPKSPEETMENPIFENGTVLSSSFGPDKNQPIFNFFSMDLTSVYSEKMKSYVRDYVFINMMREDIPAIIILKDQMETTDPSFKKYWQINTLKNPIVNSQQIVLNNERLNKKASTYVNFIYPNQKDLEVKLLSGSETFNVFGFQVTPPELDQAESNAHRILVSPRSLNKLDKFLTTFQMTNDGINPLQIPYEKVGNYDLLKLENKLIYLRDGNNYSSDEIKIDSKINQTVVFITGVAAGEWKLKTSKGKIIQSIHVEENKNTIIISLKKGKYKIEITQ